MWAFKPVSDVIYYLLITTAKTMKKTRTITMTLILAGSTFFWPGCSREPSISPAPTAISKSAEAQPQNPPTPLTDDVALIALQEEDGIQIIRYDLKKAESVDQFLSPLPEQTTLGQDTDPREQSSFPLQFAAKTAAALVLLHKDETAVFFHYDYAQKNWNELLQTKREIRDWIFDSDNNQLILLSRKGQDQEDELYELYTADLNTIPLQPEKRGEFAAGTTLHSIEPTLNEAILITSASAEDKYTRTLHRLNLNSDAPTQSTLILAEERQIIDGRGSQSDNLQYFAFWSSVGLAVKNLNTNQLLNVSQQPAGSLSVLWSPQSNQLLYQPHEQGIWLLNLTNGSNKQLSPLVTDTFLLWKNTSFILHLQQNALHLLNTQSGENTYIKSLSTNNKILGIH